MTYAAPPLEDHGCRENTMFIGCAPKSDGVNTMHFIPGLSSDMKALEAGVAMLSSEHNELVLFDPSLDTPVEALHCLPLGVAKYLIEHLVKVTLTGRPNEDRMTRLTRQFKHHENNRSYTRNFRKNIRHVGSFVGRDYKQLIQIPPVIIASEYTDVVAEYDILLLNEPLKVLARLCSLIFAQLTKALYEFVTLTNNSKPFSTRPKVHYLQHLHKDIRRFGCTLQFETEKGEMFNKFIREQLFHTNRHTPSRDVVIRFEFLLRDEEAFRLKFFGAHEYAKNNYDPVKATPTSGFSGVFKSIDNSCCFVGVVNEDSKTVKKYTVSEIDIHGR
ncbi:MAG: hypothetical protein EXX96DRAFT_634349 [Benjaminiella poitrasii]|nr:MAG: hypothetical protein EXX96DRAFT_634349 [Benjaminiella poitrasii]